MYAKLIRYLFLCMFFCVINFYAFQSLKAYIYLFTSFWHLFTSLFTKLSIFWEVFLQDKSKSVQTHGLKFGKHKSARQK